MTAVGRDIGCVTEFRAYYARKRVQSKAHNQAILALGRHVVCVWLRRVSAGG